MHRVDHDKKCRESTKNAFWCGVILFSGLTGMRRRFSQTAHDFESPRAPVLVRKETRRLNLFNAPSPETVAWVGQASNHALPARNGRPKRPLKTEAAAPYQPRRGVAVKLPGHSDVTSLTRHHPRDITRLGSPAWRSGEGQETSLARDVEPPPRCSPRCSPRLMSPFFIGSSLYFEGRIVQVLCSPATLPQSVIL